MAYIFHTKPPLGKIATVLFLKGFRGQYLASPFLMNILQADTVSFAEGFPVLAWNGWGQSFGERPVANSILKF